MKKVTPKQLKNLIAIGGAKSADNLTEEQKDALRPVERLAYSRGVYGANGLLFRGADGALYAVTGRNSALFYFL